ncbi:MAG: DUF928 domain-containing protein [Methylococcales bacterium]|nr:DUF928 domain-containing protein [Methylococcales bacterium]
MNIHSKFFVIIALVSLSFSGYADSLEKLTTHKYNQNKKENTDGKTKPTTQNSGFQKLIYTPPLLGAPSTSRLVGMALRGSTTELLFSVLTPAHTGLSLDAQPDIYWYTSNSISTQFKFVEFVLNSDEAIKPILRTHLPAITKGGVQKIKLADYNITLEPEIEYTWVISLVSDPAARSYDLVTSGKIKYVAAASEQFNKTVSENQQAYTLAQAGFWYDALDKTIEKIEKKATESIYRKELVSLLKQVELDQIAENISHID